jgi:micrococcal nuclease
MLKVLQSFLLFAFVIVHISCHSESKGNKDLLAVMRIIDGDTFVVYGGSKKGEKIRLIGVDAPESRKTFNKEIGFYGKEAKLYLTKLLKGKRVKLEYDVVHKDLSLIHI